MMLRRVQPELLDSLPPDHPDALHNRRDLRFFNAVMGNFRWFARTLREHLRPGDRLLELGAGEGDLGKRLGRDDLRVVLSAPAKTDDPEVVPPENNHPRQNGGNRIPMQNCRYTGLDLWPRPANWPEAWGWRREDLTTFPDYGQFDVILGNLILHQFEDAVLAALGRRWREHARLLVFCEPVRRPLHLRQLPLARLAGINHVSRHDARVSIEGGFSDAELPRLLGVDQPPWRVELQTTFLGAYRMVASRDDD